MKTLLHLFTILFIVTFVLLSPVAFSVPEIPPPPIVPIDGGIGFLIAAGIGYGAKKLHDLKKKR